MNITLILYRPAQKGGKKPEVQDKETLKGVFRTQMEPKFFRVVRHGSSSTSPQGVEVITSDCKTLQAPQQLQK